MNLQNAPYIQNQRNFPTDSLQSLATTMDRTYIDLAYKINERTVGVFSKDNQIVTGESWYLNGQPTKQQTIRKVFTFTSTSSINHGINFDEVDQFTRMYGQFTNGTFWFGLNAGSNVAIAGQITFYVSQSLIIFNTGAGAPTLQSGNIILEWLANF